MTTTPPTVRDVTAVLEDIAPLRFAASWDNVGLLIGSPSWDVTRIMLTIDLTEDVLEEAIASGTGLVVAYHPPIFDPLKRLTDGHEKERIALRAARADLAVYAPHTALDAAPNGLTDWLARGLGSGDVRALTSHRELPPSEAYKVITYCPRDAVEQIRGALATIGAGRIGDYRVCSFELEGMGTFLGEEGTSPTVGTAGQLERVSEVRLEMVCSESSLGLAALTIQQVHPYEEPPIEFHRLEPRPRRDVGEGRRLMLDQPASMEELVSRAKATLGIPYVRVAMGRRAPDLHQTIGVCAGAGGSMIDEAIGQGCDVFLTGEMRHHDVLDAVGRGCSLILPGHTNTERGYLPLYRDRLVEGLAGAIAAEHVVISERDRSTFVVA